MDSATGTLAETDLRDEDTLLDFDTTVLTARDVSRGAREGSWGVSDDSSATTHTTFPAE